MSELAEFNIAFLAVELDDPALAPYLEAVGAVISEAEAADGFGWRDQYLAAFDDPNPFGPDALATISTWRSLEALRAFTYAGHHRAAFSGRHEWFRNHDAAAVVLWWVDDGHRPDPDEAKARLAFLVENGPSEHAFTFARRFPAPD